METEGGSQLPARRTDRHGGRPDHLGRRAIGTEIGPALGAAPSGQCARVAPAPWRVGRRSALLIGFDPQSAIHRQCIRAGLFGAAVPNVQSAQIGV